MAIILGINGSPRCGGNTEILLGNFLEGAAEGNAQTESLSLGSLSYSPCLECENLGNNEICIVKDDMQDLFKKVKETDIIAVASPIFFGSLSAQTKMMIDRFQCHWRAKNILGMNPVQKRKKGFFLCVEASRRDDFLENAKSIIKNYFATVNAEYSGEVFCKGADEKGAVLKQPNILEKSRQLGRELALS